MLPPLGSFLRPIGRPRFMYAMRVVQHFDPSDDRNLDWPAIEYERWGIRDGRPVDDGHVGRGHYIDLIPTAIPGVWRWPIELPHHIGHRRHDESTRWGQPSHQGTEVYYRLIPVDQHGQADLFGQPGAAA